VSHFTSPQRFSFAWRAITFAPGRLLHKALLRE